jgi:hypothetical protein
MDNRAVALMLVAAYWTSGTPYAEEARRLRETCLAHRCIPDIRERPHPGSWRKAQALSASVILDVRRDHPGVPFIYVDADARIMAPLDEAQTWAIAGYDAAFYWFDSPNRSPDGTGLELCSGTTWWNDTPGANELLNAWVAACALPETADLLRGGDQEALQLLVNARPSLHLKRLPHEWCWMDRMSEARYGPRQPVIWHGQASRRYKRVV